MKRIIKYRITMLIGLMVAMVSCNQDELFDREQYKHVFDLLSDDTYNIYSESHDLTEEQSVGHITASMGGALATDRDVTITLVEDLSLLSYYNTTNFDIDESKYARLLPPSHYSLASSDITIKAGERRGMTAITVKPNGLSPDTLYFLPLRVESYTAYELNSKKSTVMYRVLLKNYYAFQTTSNNYTTYSFRGKRDGVNVMGEKAVFPLGGNKVRMVAGNEQIDYVKGGYTPVKNLSIQVEVGDDGHVTITPWKDLKLTQVDGDPNYPNVFKIVDDGYGQTFKTFLLNYKYFDASGVEHTMQDEVRLAFYEDKY